MKKAEKYIKENIKNIIIYIFVLIFILATLIVSVKNNYIIFNSKIEKIEYPQKGIVSNEDIAIKLADIYLNGLNNFNSEIVKTEDLTAEYDDELNAWIVKTKDIEDKNLKVTDTSTVIVIRKEDAKVLYFSLY